MSPAHFRDDVAWRSGWFANVSGIEIRIYYNDHVAADSRGPMRDFAKGMSPEVAPPQGSALPRPDLRHTKLGAASAAAVTRNRI